MLSGWEQVLPLRHDSQATPDPRFSLLCNRSPRHTTIFACAPPEDSGVVTEVTHQISSIRLNLPSNLSALCPFQEKRSTLLRAFLSFRGVGPCQPESCREQKKAGSMHRVDAFHIFACFRMTNPPMSTSFRSHQYPAQRRFSHPGSLQSAVELHCLAKSTLSTYQISVQIFPALRHAPLTRAAQSTSQGSNTARSAQLDRLASHRSGHQYHSSRGLPSYLTGNRQCLCLTLLTI